jgi:NAD(P)H-hydrate repair Nnr-like enzyme with NAD(P)H-hydrate dehydratase domain
MAHALTERQTRGLTTVLTPHPLEAARLLGLSAQQVQRDRLAAARQLARQTGAVVVLKGSGTLIAEPAGRVWINHSGNARLGTAGSGDVLAGWLAGGWSAAAGHMAAQADTNRQKPAEKVAELAAAAVWWHGRAAELSQGEGDGGNSDRLPLLAADQIASICSAMSSAASSAQ